MSNISKSFGKKNIDFTTFCTKLGQYLYKINIYTWGFPLAIMRDSFQT